MAEYDYIIVGAGSAGCVLAHRLAAGGKHQVLLIEAGGSDSSPWIQIPIGYGRTFNDPRYNWMYQSEPDPALANRVSFVPRGKVLGGSGAINALVWIRGQPRDFDDWHAAGNPGWAWRDVLSYFRRCEDYVGGASEYHGAGGPLHINEMSAEVHPLCAEFIAACETLGIPPNADFNGAVADGAGLWQMTIERGRRVSTASGYLRPALKWPNLELRLRAHVLRVLLAGRRATGVEYAAAGRKEIATARLETILCAGAINTPQLLLLSGVGDAEQLTRLGIPVQHHLPGVGQGLQDHLALSYYYRSRVPTLNDELYSLSGKIHAVLRYALTRRGPLAMSVNQAGAFVRTLPGQGPANLQLYFNPLSYTNTPGSRRRIMSPDPYSAFLVSFNSCRPTSRGSIALASSDPRAAPVIRTNYLATAADLQDVPEGGRLLRQIAAAAPLARLVESELRPGVEVQSNAELLEDFRARAGSVFHACGTCAMGPDPARAVVDARLRVHGLERLRVVDASIFPTITSGNTNAPVVMVAEKGSDLILEDHRLNAAS